MIKSYKHEIIVALFLIGACVAFYFLYGLLLPFVLGLFFAFSCKPIISRIQKVFKNRNLATTVFLVASGSLIVLCFLLLTSFVNRDFQRLSQSFTTLAADNGDAIDRAAQKAKSYLGSIYDFDQLEETLIQKSDSLMDGLQNIDESALDLDAIKAGYDQVVSAFGGGKEKVENDNSRSGFGFLYMLAYTLVYFLLILYQMAYFTAIQKKYSSRKLSSRLDLVMDDFNQSFVKYFRLRTRIVLILSILYITAFLIMDMPGMILITVFIVLLSYVPYLQYLALIPLAIGCLVLSIENPPSFLIYFGITLGVFTLASVIEEMILTPRIMEKHIGLNPVIMILALTVWEYLLGLQGLLLGIPITILLIIFVKRYFLTSYEKVVQEEIP